MYIYIYVRVSPKIFPTFVMMLGDLLNHVMT